MPTTLSFPRRSAAPSRRAALVRIVSACLVALRLLRRWGQRHRQRCDLAELDDRLLDDIGVTRERAEKELRKPFWR